MFQDIAPHVFHNEYRPKRPSENSYGMIFEGGKMCVLVRDGKIDFPTFAQLGAKNPHIYEDYTYLFEIDDRQFYLLKNVALDMDYKLFTRRELREKEPQYLSFAGVTAFQLNGWYENNRFCGKCGTLMKHDEKERMMKCELCGRMEYPKISPAVIVGVTNGNKILLSKYRGRSYTKYALLAGFIEIGETVEQGIQREVFEEVGIKLKNIRYYKSQPWPFSDSLLMGFYADLDGDDNITLDQDELALAEWFEREDIPVTDIEVSLTNEMILNFKHPGKYENK